LNDVVYDKYGVHAYILYTELAYYSKL